MKRILCFFACGVLLAAGCAKKPEKPARPPVPVRIVETARKAMPVQVTAIGNVEAYSTVEVRSQVSGTLSEVHFKEGQDVRQGDLLFVIDPRPFETQLRQTEANFKRDTAQLDNANVQVKRYEELVKKGYVAQEQYDQVRTNLRVLEETVAADKTAVDNARLQLEYCRIRSFISGRTGRLLVHAGNLVKANDTQSLVVISRVQPIYAAFSVPEQDLADIRKYAAAGSVTVEAVPGEDRTLVERGVLDFIDRTVDAATGTITLKAKFANANRRLWPGQFVNIVVSLTTEPAALVVPSTAIQNGQQGTYVFVVKPDSTVEMRLVTIKRAVGAEMIIESGLQPGDPVVVDGQLQLVPGSKIAAKK